MALMPVAEAQARLLADLDAGGGTGPEAEAVSLAAAVGRVLAGPVPAAVAVPPWDNSAMDGYAVRSADCQSSATWLPVAQRIAAGQVGAPLAGGTAARIFTGAPLPEGADAVVVQEDCREERGRVRIAGPVPAGAHVRRRAEDLAEGAPVLAAGRRLAPADLGLLASVGVAEVACRPRLRVALLAAGDELLEPGRPPVPGCIYNSNRPLLTALLLADGFWPCDLGRMADVPHEIAAALQEGARQADCILSCGGMSVGEEDHVRAAVQARGRLDLWRVAIKPGKPLGYGRVDDVPWFGLPGNPGAVFTLYQVVLRPCLMKMAGVTAPLPPPLPVRADFEHPASRRQEYLRSRLFLRDGTLWARPHPNQSSGLLFPASWGNALVVVEPEVPVRRGQVVQALPYAPIPAPAPEC